MQQVLINARALIETSAGWLANGYAANAQGQWRPIGSPESVRFTLLGAIIRVAGGSKETLVEARALFKQVSPELFERLMSDDEVLSHEESLHLLDLAIVSLDAESKRYVPKYSGIVSRGEADQTDTSLAGLGQAVARSTDKR